MPDPWRLTGRLDYIGDEIQALVDRIAADTECEARPGEVCLGCTARLSCPCRDTATLQAVCGTTPEGMLRQYLWHKGQMAELSALLSVAVQETGEVVVPDEGAKWGWSTPTPSFKTDDYRALVDLAIAANDALTTSQTKLPGVARLLKIDKDRAFDLFTHPDWREKAADVLKPGKPGKPRIGLRGVADEEDEESNDAA